MLVPWMCVPGPEVYLSAGPRISPGRTWIGRDMAGDEDFG